MTCREKDDDATSEFIDTSWIELYEDEEKYYTMFYPEKASEIKVNMLYINKENELEKIGENMLYLNPADKINRMDLVKLIKETDKLDNIQYKLTGIRVYNIDLNHTDLKHFMSNPNKYDFTTEIRNMEDYVLKPTINCLQDVNRIYILFTEDTLHEKKTGRNNNSTNHHQTKRIKFNIDHKKTRKKR
jgi:hypothetical protein|tara:strand:+ start:3413 stop:3973 length:561 start_codon:yes stop_codon:yes gene_type:complete